jgi:2-polyprenyl-6-methoxyphenol hydroxylase-like FAD-dependent oxidoreductase
MTASSKGDVDVLIVGAGPTGLVLALWLTKLGVRVRVIDKTLEPGTTSRAVAVQARTLELYRQVGIADEVESRGRKMVAANFWTAGRRASRLVIGDIGTGLSPYPYALIFPQDEHERLLLGHLAALNVHVERGTELIAFEEAVRVHAHLRCREREESCRVDYIVGCDGTHSSVRDALHLEFPGGTYEHLFYVADVDAAGDVMNGDIHVALDATDFLVVFPLVGEGHARLIGTVREEFEHQHAQLSWNDVSQQVIAWMRIDVRRVHWFSTYRVHHRVANHFRRGRGFIAGDAAHVHSPVGGQGMNTGIGDAVNLAWKLAAVLHGRASADMLDTYESERIAFANRLVATTDRVFTGVTSRDALARWVRLDLAPRVLPALFTIGAVRRFMFRTVSQTAIDYRNSALSEGAAGTIHGGDRLPWVEAPGVDNFQPLVSLDWQVHVYGDARPDLREVCEMRGLSLHVFPWRSEIRHTGLRRNAAYLVRPDGYVGLVDRDASAKSLAAYLDVRGIKAQPTRQQLRAS